VHAGFYQQLTVMRNAVILTYFEVLSLHFQFHKISEPRELHVVVGTNIFSTGGDVYDVDKLALHPRNDYFTHKHDVAVLRTKTKMKMGETVWPIALQVNAKVGEMATAAGWGDYEKDDELSDILKYDDAQVITNEDCKSGLRPDLRQYIYDHTVVSS
jgi:hypothetical protein